MQYECIYVCVRVCMRRAYLCVRARVCLCMGCICLFVGVCACFFGYMFSGERVILVINYNVNY